VTIPQRTITRDDALTQLRNAVEDRGADYVYPGTDPDSGGVTCRYFADYEVPTGEFGQDGDNPHPPACIVGHALSQLGVTYEDVTAVKTARNLTNTASARALLPALPGLDVTPEALEAFADAQDAQDCGLTWGDAITAAQDSHEN
jgi:hypothetical protein